LWNLENAVIRRIGQIIFGLSGLVAVAALVVIVVVLRIDVRSKIESIASERLGRTVRIESLAIGWADALTLRPLKLEATGLHLANPPWGSTPDMVRAERVRAEIALPPLLHGQIRLAHVVVERPVVVLEHNFTGVANWVFPALGPKRSGEPLPVALPDIYVEDMLLSDGDLTFLTSHGNLLRVHASQANLIAMSPTSPVKLRAEGSYNDIPLTADVSLESFTALRRVPRPVATDITVTSKGSVLRFNGTMTDPIGFDGLKGAVDLNAVTSEEVSEALGRERVYGSKLVVKGLLEKHGDHWRVTELDGKLADTQVSGAVGLDEGKRGSPDHFDVDLDFGVLDVKRLTDRMSTNSQVATPRKGIPLQVDKAPGETYKIRVGVQQAIYGGFRLDAVEIEGSVEPGRVVLGKLAFGLADGRITLAGTDETQGENGHLRLNAALEKASAGKLLAMAGADASMLTGTLLAGATLEMTGITTDDAMRSSRGQAVLSMSAGRMSRQFLQMASIDIRLLFRKGQGATPVTCFLGVASAQNGVLTLAPLRLRTNEGTLFGGGQINLFRETLDIHLQSDRNTTNFFALDLPVHLEGTFTNPKPGVTFRSGAREWDARGPAMLRILPPDLRRASGSGRC